MGLFTGSSVSLPIEGYESGTTAGEVSEFGGSTTAVSLLFRILASMKT